MQVRDHPGFTAPLRSTSAAAAAISGSKDSDRARARTATYLPHRSVPRATIMLTIIAVRGGGYGGADRWARGGRACEILAAVTTESIAALRSSGVGSDAATYRYGGLALSDDEFVWAVASWPRWTDHSVGSTAAFNAAASEVAGLPRVRGGRGLGRGSRCVGHQRPSGRRGLVRDDRLTGRWESVVGAEQADWLLLPAGNGVNSRAGAAHRGSASNPSAARPASTPRASAT